jgi:hypothetical protein
MRDKDQFSLRESSITPFTFDFGSMTDNGNPLEGIPLELAG